MASSKKYATYHSLEDRVIVISGGAQGIGASMVAHFAQQGSKVVFLDINESASSLLLKSLQEQNVKHVPEFHQCDLTDIEGSLVPTAQAILTSHPVIHGLINNAAGAPKSQRIPTLSITAKSWNASLSVNLSHQFFLTQTLLPALFSAAEVPDASDPYSSTVTASIINMGSITWAIPSTGSASYATCKSAVVGLTRTLAHEFGPKGVRVNSIMPGSIATEAEVRDVHSMPGYKENILHRQALSRFVAPGDVARMALWLVSDDSEAVTNQSFVCDGGWI